MQLIDLNESYVFTKVVQAGSFIRAAEIIGMPKQTVSAKIASLEERLGVTLLKRTTRKLSLTDAGKAYYQKCVEGVQLIQAADAEAAKTQNEIRGTLRVTAPLDFSLEGLRDTLREFTKRYPNIEVNLLFSNQFVDLVAEGIDVAIRAGNLEDSSMIAKRLGYSTFIPVASPKYLKGHGQINHPRDLESLNCFRSTFEAANIWEFKHGRERSSVRVSGKIAANHLLLLKELAIAGEGVALLPSGFCHADLEKGRLVRLIPEWVSNIDPIHVIYPAHRFVPPQIQAFVDVLTEYMERLFPEVERH